MVFFESYTRNTKVHFIARLLERKRLKIIKNMTKNIPTNRPLATLIALVGMTSASNPFYFGMWVIFLALLIFFPEDSQYE